MNDDSEAKQFLSELRGRPAALASKVHGAFLKNDCKSYVKTIYIGYEIEGEMVAALYHRGDHLEVALALPEDHASEILIDATHLTWRTLPVAAIVKLPMDLDSTLPLIEEACARIREKSHVVNRDNEFFAKARRERRLGRA